MKPEMGSGRNNNLNTTSTLQQPVRSNRGGYLRCPFSIQSDLAAVAERHAGSAFNSHKAHAIRRTEERLHSNNNNKRENEDYDSDENGRPWSRAGVGAQTLTAKERRAQQEEAERIYGINNSDDYTTTTTTTTNIVDGNSASGSVSVFNSSHASPSDGLPVALAPWEKSALQRVVPRGVQRNNGKHMELEDNKGMGFRSKQRQSYKEDQDVQDAKFSLNKRQRDNNTNNNNNNNKKGNCTSDAGQTQRKSCEDEREQKTQKREVMECTTPKPMIERSRQEIKKPMNRLQKFDEMRNAALFGKKKGSKR